MRLEGATDLEAGAGALAKGCPALRDVSFSRAPRLSADALEPLFGLGRLQSLVLVTCPNVGDALLEDLDELSEDRWLPLRRLELVRTCVEIKILRRVRRPPRHRRDACSIAWRCRFLTARRSQRGHVIADLT